MEGSLKSVDDHEQVPVSVVDVSGFSKVDFLLLVLVQSTIFTAIVRISVIDVGVASVVKSLESCSNSAESLIEVLVRREKWESASNIYSFLG